MHCPETRRSPVNPTDPACPAPIAHVRCNGSLTKSSGKPLHRSQRHDIIEKGAPSRS
ncbi:hypothetical protein BAUCODRAFT_36795 [Baudoinia panamericana UAMH 10762]|uniref:Uncharacterized protein n=1 Tax=Baudoinia panamericana (strain UAMH 10762) TaxID=717646 RepID=M2N2C1_BAUPA|nr:uncharacterized protein BAUCODRAFT_36795 [Baudoinia panamericana UAMH 10762]EMC93129.1 hypothetical protein BAUCODRAFT_36795 [Baudoinia panamericana UAMH 10762]